ncbi:MAG: hypothetical protein H0X31_13490 [Nostocaceae cyanobacterium]|nr:hypothetical protein [Nostocaceae cyanobacterium]
MTPAFNPDGNLPPGVHWTTWQEFVERFGTTPHRQQLLKGLKSAIDLLSKAGCQVIYIDGSFVTSKENPNDYDGCWDVTGVDPYLLDPILLNFDNDQTAQKIKYLGELFPAETLEGRVLSSIGTKNRVKEIKLNFPLEAAHVYTKSK